MTDSNNLESLKKKAVIEALKSNKVANEAAKSLGVSRATLYRMMKKYSIDRKCLHG